MMTIVCKNCGKKAKKPVAGYLFCSMKCGQLYRRKPRVCPGCGKSFYSCHSHTSKFCTSECGMKSKRRFMDSITGINYEQRFGVERAAQLREQMSRDRAGKRRWKIHPMLGKHHSPETIAKMSEVKMGTKNSSYGKPPHGVIACRCKKGHWVRSTWELAVCNWLYNHDISYEYEPVVFDFNGLNYTPDIYIPRWNVWWEIKGWWTERSVQQIKEFRSVMGENSIMIIDKENITLFKEDV